MCGIIGYVGFRPLASILIEGLKRLEYRGYDSAGIASVYGNKINCLKKSGKVSDLETSIDDNLFHGNVGIAHTRWATHGIPNQVNAHPHLDSKEKIALVHNGIIENYNIIREFLISKGVELKSETDSEVLVHLISTLYNSKENFSFEDAVRAALKEVVVL